MWSTARSEASLAALEASFPVPIELRRIKTARRLRLRFDEGSGTLRLTCPWRTSRRAALAWAADQREWINAQVSSAAPMEPFAPGASFPLEGADVRIVWREHWPRSVRQIGDELYCGGPGSGVQRRIETFLKSHARNVLSRDVAEFANAAGVQPRSVSVGDAATRWGSCSSRGSIRLNWRLVMAPPQARRFVAAHEVAHLVHLNHGPAFKALEARLFGAGLAEAKALLRRTGPRLRRIGRPA